MSEAAKTSYHGYFAHMAWVIPWFVMLVNTRVSTNSVNTEMVT